MAIELRTDYQLPVYTRTRDLVKSGVRRIAIVMPTGAGKGDLGAYILQQAVSKGANAQYWVHRRELVKQSVLALSRAGVMAGIIASGFQSNPNAAVQVCSVQSLRRRYQTLPIPKLIICDELHHSPAKTWHDLLTYYSNAGSIIIGMSATPWRLQGESLRPYYDEMVIGASTAELIDKGWLSPYRLFTPGHLDMTGVRTTAGDYNKHELDDRMRSTTVMGDCLSHYQKYVPGKQALIFTWSIESSMHIAERFNAAGISAAHVDGETDARVRDRAIESFAKGDLKVLSNVEIFGEGLNLPGITALFMLRPTQSLTMYLQMVGRALRPAPGKAEAWIFDHAHNVKRHSTPCAIREWNLDSQITSRRKRKKDDDTANYRICPECSETYSLGTMECACGYVFPVQSREIEHDADAELAEIGQQTIRNERMREQKKARDLDALIEVGRRRGYAYPLNWARHIIRAREEKSAMRTRQESTPVALAEEEDRWLF